MRATWRPERAARRWREPPASALGEEAGQVVLVEGDLGLAHGLRVPGTCPSSTMRPARSPASIGVVRQVPFAARYISGVASRVGPAQPQPATHSPPRPSAASLRAAPGNVLTTPRPPVPVRQDEFFLAPRRLGGRANCAGNRTTRG